MRVRHLGMMLPLVVLLSQDAGASVVMEMSDEEMAVRADVVVRGQVVAARSRQGERSIVTDYTIRVEEKLKGDVRGAVVVTELGGRIGERRHFAPGTPSYRVGDHVVAFLFRHGTELRTVGMAQGLFFVRTDAAGDEILLRDLGHTTLAAPDSDGMIRPDTTLTQQTEAPRTIGGMRALVVAQGGNRRGTDARP